MKFFIQWDGVRKTRARTSTWRVSTYDTVNEAIIELKKTTGPHRLCISDNGKVSSLIFYEGCQNIGCFTPGKKESLESMGNGMYVPARFTRKTNIKRKKKCKKSSNLTKPKASPKYTQ